VERATEDRVQTDAIVAIDGRGRVVLFDLMAERLFGYAADEVLGKNVTMLMPEAYRDRHTSQLARYVATGESHILGSEIHVDALRRDGSLVPVALRVSELPAHDDERLFVAAICDLGARELMHEARWYREVFDLAMVGIALVDPTGRYVWTNHRMTEILGYSAEELRSCHFQDLTHPDDVAKDDEHLRLLLEGAISIYATEKRYLRRDGSAVWVEVWARRLEESDGGPRHIVAILVDIDRRKRAEDADRATLSLLRATLESTADGLLVVDLDGHIVSYNRRFATMWGIPEPVLASKNDEAVLEHMRPQLADPEAYLERVHALYGRPSVESFDIVELGDGRAFERYSKPQVLENEIIGRVFSFRDVTPRRVAEERLRRSQELLAHAQKMEAMGRLAGGVAHDFNNLLSVITGYANLLGKSLPETDRRQRYVQPITSAVDRAAALTAQLLAFSRKQPRKLAVLDLNLVVRDVEDMLARLLGEDITVETHLAPSLWPVFADRGQLEQVIVNLAVNARDAMSGGGVLRITTSNVRGEGGPDAVCLEVADTGVGMDEATKAHIFEPFFTTKPLGHGTGLGLSTVHGIVEQSGGSIEVESELGRGTTFTVRLPASRGIGEETPTSERVRGGGERGRETILLVEDHVELRGLVRVVLESRGYRVLLAQDPAEALAVARKEDVDLLLADVVLPRSSGPEIFAALQAEHPNLAVLYVSGYLELHGRAVFDARAPFLAKPFSPDALARKVREVLDGG
jgi:PAS domain S-box-containing protein